MTKYEFWAVTFFVIFIGFSLMNIVFGLKQAVAVFIMFIILCLLVVGIGFFVFLMWKNNRLEKDYE